MAGADDFDIMPRMNRSYLDQHLVRGESVVYRGRPHAVALLRPLGLFAGALVLLAFAAAEPQARVGGLLGLALALAALPGYLRWRSLEYIVTNRRFCVRAGTFRVETVETVLNKVGTIGVVQDPFGRLLGYGTVVIKGLGGSCETLPAIASPFTLRGKVHEALAAPSH